MVTKLFDKQVHSRKSVKSWTGLLTQNTDNAIFLILSIGVSFEKKRKILWNYFKGQQNLAMVMRNMFSQNLLALNVTDNYVSYLGFEQMSF